MRTLAPVLALLAALFAVSAHAEEHVVVQKNKSFPAKKLTVHVGDTVKFVNDDPFAHNIFSLSDTKSFDLGSYGHGLSKSVTMDRPGEVDVECAVHPEMKMTIQVQP